MSRETNARILKQPPRAVPPRSPVMQAAASASQISRPMMVAPRAPLDPVLQGLINTIATLEAVVEEETAALAARQKIDLDAYSHRKSQGLMELNHAMKHMGAMKDDRLVRDRLTSLRTKVDANQAALKLHLEAVTEIASIIAGAIRESESDGTYSHTIRRAEAAYGYD